MERIDGSEDRGLMARLVSEESKCKSPFRCSRRSQVLAAKGALLHKRGLALISVVTHADYEDQPTIAAPRLSCNCHTEPARPARRR
jgi:hypothetical protein